MTVYLSIFILPPPPLCFSVTVCVPSLLPPLCSIPIYMCLRLHTNTSSLLFKHQETCKNLHITSAWMFQTFTKSGQELLDQGVLWSLMYVALGGLSFIANLIQVMSQKRKQSKPMYIIRYAHSLLK